MAYHERTRDEELYGIVDEKLTAFVRELEDADWSVDEIAFTIEAILDKNWLVQARALRAARDSVPENFVSDGNEG
jgi:hypothetical protein